MSEPVTPGGDPRRSPDLPGARDGDVAVREEFASAERANTPEAWRMFAQRHPRHPLAAEATRRADALEEE